MYGKISINGPNGSGKSFTSALLGVALSKEYADSRPVFAFDSENRWSILKALIFDVEKVPLVIVRGTSLPALQDALQRCRNEQGAVFIGDQLTTPWMEALQAFSYSNGNLPFDRRQQLMNQWDAMVRSFKGPFHAIAAGRLGFHWENVEDAETGDIKLVQGDPKFNAGGSSNFGYECELELEIRRKNTLVGKLLKRKKSISHICSVVKDVTTMLSGAQFNFPDTVGGYKAGGYKVVLNALRPHLDFMQRLEAPQFDPAQEGHSSKQLLVSGKTAWATDHTERKALLEELDANLQMCFPAGEGKSKIAKMFRDLTLEYLNGFISWSRMEEEVSTEDLSKNLFTIQSLRRRIERGEIPTNQQSLTTLLDLATDDLVRPGGKNVTFLEAMGIKSLESLGPLKKPVNGEAQPIVRLAENCGD